MDMKEEDNSDMFDAVLNTPDATEIIKKRLMEGKDNDNRVDNILTFREARNAAGNNIKLNRGQCSGAINDVEYAQIICSEGGYTLCHDRPAAKAECAKKFKFFLVFSRNTNAERDFLKDIKNGVFYMGHRSEYNGMGPIKVPANNESGYDLIKPMAQRMWEHDPSLPDHLRAQPPDFTNMSPFLPFLDSKDINAHLSAVVSALKEEAGEIKRLAPNEDLAEKTIRDLNKTRSLELWPSGLGDEFGIQSGSDELHRLVNLYWCEDPSEIYLEEWQDILPFYY